MVIGSQAAAEALADGLGHVLRVVRRPMSASVAQLDTAHDRWVLYLDSDSPPEDLCWAMLQVLSLVLGESPSARIAATGPEPGATPTGPALSPPPRSPPAASPRASRAAASR